MSKNSNSTNPPYSEQWSDDLEPPTHPYSQIPVQHIPPDLEAPLPPQPSPNPPSNSSPFYNLKSSKKSKKANNQPPQLPFQDRFHTPQTQHLSPSERPQYIPVQHYLEELENHLYEMEDRLTRRIYWLQRRLATTEDKVDTQRKFIFGLIIVILGFFYFTFIRVPKSENTPEVKPVPQSIQPQPS